MGTDLTKRCSICGENKPLTEFHRRADRPCGAASKCKACKAKSAAEYRGRNIEVCKERSLDWYRRNKDRSIETTRAWQDAHKERVKEKRRQWRERLKENRPAK